jgi:hypothetical protein
LGGGSKGISLGCRSTSLSVQACVRFLLIELDTGKAPHVRYWGRDLKKARKMC